jgi:PAS domain S-box-containing protein
MQLEAANRALIRDISERELVEISLKESEERFHELAENINEVFWVSDVHRHLIDYVSPAYEKIWGRPCEALYADPNTWLEAIHPEDQERVYKAAVAWQTEGAYDEEYRIVRPDETVRWIHDSGFPVRDGEGKVKRMVGVARDITENRELEEQFRQIQKMEAIGQLAGGVAHDFNNMLAVIAMQAGLLGADKSLSARQAELVRDMEAVVQRGADLTRQLLVFSRRQTMQPQDLDMNVIVTNVGKMIWRILGEDIRMQVNVASQPMYVNADAGMMDQVLMNLTVNARDAMPEGGTLIIGTSAVSFQESDKAKFPQTRPGSFVCLSVRDRGCGIAPENLTRIFEPFFTTKEVGKGTGLGLATVFGIVHQHQGWISVESEVGDGTTFRVYLPAVSSPEGVASAQPAETAALGGKETILMVEDDPSLRGFVRMTLSRLGYRVLEAATGAGALEAWKQNRAEIRLLLTDMVLPGGMTGRELAQRLLEEKPGLQIIYVSGYSAETVVKDLCLEEGVNFLRKPFKAQKLAQTLRAKLDASGV